MDSRDVATAAVRIAVTGSFEEENEVKSAMHRKGIAAAAVNFGGDFITSVNKIIERAVVAAKREGLIDADKGEECAVAGAAREAVSQIAGKAVGLSVGGKIGIARAERLFQHRHAQSQRGRHRPRTPCCIREQVEEQRL